MLLSFWGFFFVFCMFFLALSKLYIGDKMNLIWYLLIYSFFGFCAEILFARVTHSRKQDRKCRLFLPLCPVYGVGATAIALLPPEISGHPLLLFLTSAIIASVTEYGMSFFYEKAWGVSFWDYSAQSWNVQGRICLSFSLIWGFLGLILIRYIHPLIAHLVAFFPSFLAIPALLLFMVDFLLTSLLLRRSHDTNDLIWYR